MPTRVVTDDDEQIIADLQKDMRRLRSRLATTSPRGGHDAWTAATTPATTYQLTYIPVQGTCEFAIKGHEQREGTDYTVDYATGLVTVSAALASGDSLVARYLVTDWLVARTIPPEGQGPVTLVGYLNTPTASAWPAWETTPVSGDLLVVHAIARGSGSWTVPSGWTQIRQSNVGDLYLTSWYKAATPLEIASGPGTFTPGANTTYGNALCSTWRGVNLVSPVPSQGEVASSVAEPQLVGVQDGVYLASIGWGWNDSSAPGWNPPVNAHTSRYAQNSDRSHVLVGYVPLSSSRNPEPPGSTDYTCSLGTSATQLMSQGLILASSG